MYIAIAILILVISVFITKADFPKNNQQKKVLGQQQSSSSPTPTSTPASTPTLKPTPTSSNNSSVTINQKITDSSKTSQTFNLADFKYPSSNQISSSGNNLILESSDSPDVITNWYKERIRSLGFKSKSFVQTNSNGNILNKLVAASADKEIRVEIEKSANSSKVSITITIPT